MRVIFNEEMKSIADNLEHMAQDVHTAIYNAGYALANNDLEAAQKVIEGDAQTDELEATIIDQCVKLLARQNPVATDLRIVVSTMRLATTFKRMGDLSKHIAQSVRRTYPQSPVPQDAQKLFANMVSFVQQTADRMVHMLADRDADIAKEIIEKDDVLDNLHKQVFDYVYSDEFNGTKQQLINVVLLGRFFERIGDHAVSAARRVLFIVSGFNPSLTPTRDEGTDID
ncbi:MAG: phosphate signaling complex protein PhoU [Bifidobacteriaceae bacterium]|nr:phosphate signaling complex protein PhoU [Bifidobacteriaceae bacterium]